MNKKVLFIFVMFLLLLSISSPTMSEDTVIFQTGDLSIGKWHIHYSDHKFSADNPGSAVITITKTTPDKKIAGGFLFFNYQYIPLRSFLKGQEPVFEKEIELKASNRINLFLWGTPGATINLEVRLAEGPTPPPTVTFTADPSSIPFGDSSTLSWKTSDADTVTIDNGIGDVPANGSTQVTPKETTTYTITVSGPGGTTTASTTVTVEYPPPTVSIEADPPDIQPGESAVLSWRTTYADTVSIDQGIGNVDPNGSTTVTPRDTTTYTITATGPGGTVSDNVTVSVTAVPKDLDLGIHTNENEGGGGLVGDLVRITNGNALEIRTDFQFASPHSNGLSFTAVYNSRSDAKGILGFGWTHTYAAVLLPAVDISGRTLMKIVDATGRGIYFSEDAPNQYLGVFHERSHVSYGSDEYIWHRQDGSCYGFSNRGQLVWIEDENANRLNLEYDANNRLSIVNDSASGRALQFEYDDNGQLASIQGPKTDAVASGIWVSYQYDSAQNLERVTYADKSVVLYEYADPTDSHNMTAKKDGADHLLASWAYDAQDRCTDSFNRNGNSVQIGYDQDDRVTVTDGDEVARTFTIGSIEERRRITAIEDSGDCSVCVSNAVRWEYDAAMNLTEVAYVGGAVTQYADFDTRGNPGTVVIGAGSPYERTISYIYHPRMNVPIRASEASLLGNGEKETIWDYDNDGNDVPNENPTNLLYRTVEKGYTLNVEEQVVAFQYQTTFTYNAKGQVLSEDGPMDGDSDQRFYEYDPQTGDLLTVAEPIVGSTQYTDYDAAGKPCRIIDVNGHISTMLYDGRSRMIRITREADGSTIETTYNTFGLINSTKDADDIVHTFEYDSQYGRIQRLLDADGNHIDYTYDDQGRLTQAAVLDASSTQVLLKRWCYAHPTSPGKLWREIYPDDSATTFEYDANGNLNTKTDPKNNVTEYAYDLFNRINKMTQPENAVTTFDFDRHGNLSVVADPGSHQTTYAYDDLGRLVTTISPDAGKTVYTYDPAGSMQYRKDARGIIVTHTYDALGRVTAIEYPAHEDRQAYTVTYTYDEGSSGKGRLTGMLDPSGQTQFDYSNLDTQGLLTKITTIDDNAFTTTQASTPGGRLASLTYPSGRTVTYSYHNLGKLSSIALTDGSGTTALVDNLTYSPFGPALGMNLPNVSPVQNQWDQLHRLKASNPGTGAQHGQRGFQYDANSNLEVIEAVNDPRHNQNFGYSALNRLTSATGSYGTISFSYDNTGNRLTKTEETQIHDYAYMEGSNRIESISGPTPIQFSYDPNGNTTTMGALNLTYDQNNHLLSAQKEGAVVGEYVYNALGQRVVKTAAGTTTYYHYDLQGNLIAESPPDTGFTSGTEYIYNGSSILAKVDVATSARYFFHVNHLGTPELITDADGNVVWQAVFKPYGDVEINTNSSIDNPIRFPGHYFDAETGLHYNGARYYDPAIGRYLSPDPSGLEGGLNPYVYSLNNPVNAFDQDGEVLNFVVGAATSVALGYGISLLTGESYGWTQLGTDLVLGAAGAGVLNKLKYLRSASKMKALVPKGAAPLGKWGEARLAQVFANAGTKPSKAFSTHLGNRFFDRLIGGVAHEAKAGINVGLTPIIEKQILKDAELIALGKIRGAHWHFFQGADDLLLRALERYGIKYTVHPQARILSASAFDPLLSILGGILGQGASQSLGAGYSPFLSPEHTPAMSLSGPAIPSEYDPLPETYDYLIWGSAGSGPGEFNQPVDIDVSNDGHVYVTDYDNHRIQKFDASGSYMTQWGSEGSGAGEFDSPVAVAVDDEGYVYVADRYANHRIQKFSSEGDYILEWGYDDGLFFHPMGIDIHNGHAYVTRHGNWPSVPGEYHTILVFDTSGNAVDGWGSRLTDFGICGDLEFYDPQGITVDTSQSRIYIADYTTNDIRITDLEGNFIERWGNSCEPGGSGDGEFNQPTDVVVGSDGSVYVLDQFNHRIQKFDAAGIFQISWGSQGQGEGEFSYPSHMAIDEQGYIYVADKNNNRIHKFHSSMVK